MTQSMAGRNLFGAGGRVSMSPPLMVVAAGLAVAALIALPGVTVVTRSIEDVYLQVDGISRVLDGQVPSVDFVTSLGPLVYALPALGYRISGSFGAAMPVAMALLIAALSLIAAHVLPSRLRPLLVLLLGSFLLAILAAPLNLGDAPMALSFGQFFNRVGWVAFSLLLCLHLRPVEDSPRRIMLDAAAAAALTLLMLYTRATYGLAALAFILFLLTDRHHWRAMAMALLIILLAGGLVHLLWGGTGAYFRAAFDAPAPEGILAGHASLLQPALGHVPDLLLYGLIALLALWYGRSVRDGAFFVFCALAGLWLISHNAQRWGVISLHAGAAVAAERIFRRMDAEPITSQGSLVNTGAIRLYLLAFLLPTILHCAASLLLHTGFAMAGGGTPLPLPGLAGIRFADIWTGGDARRIQEALAVSGEGLDLLARLGPGIGELAVVGGTQPFAPVLGIAPANPGAAGVKPHAGAPTARFLPSSDAVSRAQAVILRHGGTAENAVVRRYQPVLDAGFEKRGETEHWLLYARKAGGISEMPPGGTNPPGATSPPGVAPP